MTEEKMLIGSFSNDLYRVASLVQRGSMNAANKFLLESKRWTSELKNYDLKDYLKKIIIDLENGDHHLDESRAEKLLMYSILLQNYSLCAK